MISNYTIGNEKKIFSEIPIFIRTPLRSVVFMRWYVDIFRVLVQAFIKTLIIFPNKTRSPFTQKLPYLNSRSL